MLSHNQSTVNLRGRTKKTNVSASESAEILSCCLIFLTFVGIKFRAVGLGYIPPPQPVTVCGGAGGKPVCLLAGGCMLLICI